MHGKFRGAMTLSAALLVMCNLAVLVTAPSGIAEEPRSNGLTPQPFDQFLRSVAKARYEDYRELPGARVENQVEFNRMTEHILSLYKGRKAVKTMMVDGACFDCLLVPDGVAKPPPPAVAPAPIGHPRLPMTPAPSGDIREAHQVGEPAPEGSVPVMRLTLEQLVRFPKLQYFFSKDGAGGGSLPLPHKQ